MDPKTRRDEGDGAGRRRKIRSDHEEEEKGSPASGASVKVTQILLPEKPGTAAAAVKRPFDLSMRAMAAYLTTKSDFSTFFTTIENGLKLGQPARHPLWCCCYHILGG